MTILLPRFYRRRHTRRGVALLLVLSIVGLLTVVVIGFLFRSGMEQSAAASYKATSTSRLMADTAVNLIQGQINEAISQCSDGKHAWASQPGAIRTFDTSGQLVNIYRLYSAPSLVTANATDLANDLPPAGWASSPAVWVDLNAPVNDGSGNAHFPIFDSSQAGGVDGFKLNTAPGSTSTQPCPMPVQWLYVLQNGQIISPDAGGNGTIATFHGARMQPSKSNPIVGRIAYWTDDDSCKVNINTAAGDGLSAAQGDPINIANATFWSPPYFCAPDEVTLATNQPASGEYQRYPGHPATVALRNILNGLNFTTSSSQQFYTLTPRVAFGGSEGGTVAVNTATPPALSFNPLYSSVAEMLFGPPPNTGTTRPLSVINGNDSLTQKRIETAGFFLTAHSRSPELNLFGQPRVSIWPVWDPSAKTSTSGNPSAIDQLLSFCATLKTSATAGSNYYFTRKDPTNSAGDINLARNQTLLGYLDNLTSQPIPGFGGNFDSKYTQLGTRQILTEIFDYIRSTNIADGTQTVVSSAGDASVPGNQYGKAWTSNYNRGWYQVVPSVNTTWNTQGIGIFPRLTEAALQFVAVGANPSPAGATPSAAAAMNIPLSQNYTTTNIATLGLAKTGDTGTDGQSNIYNPPVNSPSATTPATFSAPAGTTAVQAFLLLQFTNPAQMRIPNALAPFVWVEIKGLDAFAATGNPPPSSTHNLNFKSDVYGLFSSAPGDPYGDYSFANFGYNNMTGNEDVFQPLNIGSIGTYTALGANPFYSAIIPINNAGNNFTFTGGSVTIKIYDGYNGSTYPTSLPASAHLIQTYTIIFPNGTFPLPTPEITIGGKSTTKVTPNMAPGSPVFTGFSLGMYSNPYTPPTYLDRWYLPHKTSADAQGNFNGGVCANDTIESMVLSRNFSDPRVLAASTISSGAFVQHPLWGGQQGQAYSLSVLQGAPLNYKGGTAAIGTLVAGISPGSPSSNYAPVPPAAPNWLYSTYPIISPMVPGGVTSVGAGDWDNGLGYSSDGPWINKADEGNLFPNGNGNPYFTNGRALNSTGLAFFSPNREVPSPGMFGSLPTGVDPTGFNPKPWQTLLFQPGPPGHPGLASPKDHLLLDLFWMPVAEPYAISEPFSTAGKVNLNYQIEPFTYIVRETAIRAVLATEKIAEIGGGMAGTYKYITGTNIGMTTNARMELNLDATLAQFDTKFATNDIFHSPSQLCEEYLIPANYSSAASFAADWYKTGAGPFALVGDNVRERPYTDIYSRVTTKSNSYSVHFTVQALKNPPADPTQWNEATGGIVGEYRGSTMLERYIDPNATIPDYAATTNPATNLETYYKWRVVENHQFAP